MWRQLPDLLFGFGPDVEGNRKMGQVYQNFADFVLNGRALPVVRKFSLYCHDNIDFQSITNWIHYAVTHSVEELKLRLEIESFDNQIEPLPESLFSCPTLVKFDLVHYGRIIFPPDSEGMRNLRIWSVRHAEFVDGPSTTQFFSQCHRLEKLTLEQCTWSCQLVQIFCPLLRRLIICVDDHDENDYRVEIIALRLQFFEYQGDAEVDYWLGDFFNLLEANVNVRCPEDILVKHLLKEQLEWLKP